MSRWPASAARSSQRAAIKSKLTAGLATIICLMDPASGAGVAATGKAPAVAAGRVSATTLAPPIRFQFPAADSVMLAGEWFASPVKGPSIVLAPRRRGPDADLRAAAAEFQRRGYSALVFALRDSQPANRETDSLRFAVLTSHWVDDMVGALRAARGRGEGTRHVFAWGQGLGAALTIAAAAREPGLCDALAAEDLFPTTDYAMRRNGTAVIPDAVKAQLSVLRGNDEPFSAAARLKIPVYAILNGRGAGRPDDVVQQAFRRNRGRTERWLRPGVESPAPLPGPAQMDTLAIWFKRWVPFPTTK
ncbi:MAG: hypothetical protein ABIS67_12240 [Candidatus Eisenbacteria bacterium]